MMLAPRSAARAARATACAMKNAPVRLVSITLCHSPG